MNADRLLALFERISEATDAIPRMRRFILDLAVRGKLVEQGLGQMVEVGCYRKLQNGYAFKSTWFAKEGVRLLRNANVGHGVIRWDDVAHISPERLQEFDRFSLRMNDIVLTLDRPFITTGTKVARIRDSDLPALLLQRVGRFVETSPGLDDDYLYLWILSPHFNEQIDPGRSNGVPHISSKQVEQAKIFVPPLAEQHRIVAKVDELMALCDQLEAARQQRAQCRERLVAASLQRLNQPSDELEAFRSDARFALQVLPSLTTTPAQIKQLRQTILNLAVRGKLVEQDPEDEPAEELLRCIAADRSLLQRTRGRLRNDEIKPIPSDLVPYELPQGWTWARFGDIMYSRDGERIPVSKDERSRRAKTYDYYGASGVIDKIDDFLFEKPLLLIGEDGANLLNRSTPIAFIARGKYWVNNHAHVLDGISEEFLRFIELTINATDLAPYVTGTAQPKMNQAKMTSIPVALPPLAEQQRIVAKVDELMALCDQLEQQLSQGEESRRGLLEAVLQEALAGRLPERPEERHAAIA